MTDDHKYSKGKKDAIPFHSNGIYSDKIKWPLTIGHLMSMGYSHSDQNIKKFNFQLDPNYDRIK